MMTPHATLLATAFNDRMHSIGSVTSAEMHKYCNAHGLDFWCIRQLPQTIPAPWNKLRIVHMAFDAGYNRVIWLDADVLITNHHRTDWQSMCKGIYVSQDWGEDAKAPEDFSAGTFVVNRDAGMIINNALSRNNVGNLNPLWCPRNALRQTYLCDDHFTKQFTILPRRALNAVPRCAASNVPEPWMKGDWICHFTGMPMDEKARRIRLQLEVQSQTRVLADPKAGG